MHLHLKKLIPVVVLVCVLLLAGCGFFKGVEAAATLIVNPPDFGPAERPDPGLVLNYAIQDSVAPTKVVFQFGKTVSKVSITSWNLVVYKLNSPTDYPLESVAELNLDGNETGAGIDVAEDGFYVARLSAKCSYKGADYYQLNLGYYIYNPDEQEPGDTVSFQVGNPVAHSATVDP